MAKKQPGLPLPPIAKGFGLPFYYASLTNIEVMYLVDEANVLPYLKDTGLRPSIFNGKAMVGFNYQQYTGQFPGFMSVVDEIELNIVSYPEKLHGEVAQVTAQQYFRGEEQSKIMGNHRVWVPCDNPNAIQAGIQLFGEPKFQTTFTTSLLSLNDPTVKTWSFTCNDPTDAKKQIFTCTAALQNLPSEWAMVSPITEYGHNSGKLIGCRWNILQPNQVYFLKPATARTKVKLTYGTSTHPMGKDMKKLIGSAPAFAVRTSMSPPAAAQSRAYFV